MKFIKKQRIELYKKAIVELQNAIKQDCDYDNMCFCIILSILGWGSYGISPIISDPTKEFPELKKYKPNNIDKVWFPSNKEGTEQRIKILQTIIKNYEKHL